MSATMSVKRLFFDSAKIIRSMDQATRKALSRVGAFVRQTARQSLKYQNDPNKASAPGRPPYVHRVQKLSISKGNRKGKSFKQAVSPLRELLFFSYDPAAKSVVTGPVKFTKGAKAIVPNVQEFGGRITRTVSARRRGTGRKAYSEAQAAAYRKLVTSGLITVPPAVKVKKTANYPPRPYMGPSLKREIAKGTIPKQWAGSLKGD